MLWSTALISSVAAIRIFGAKQKKKTEKMLAEDGSLVEIDSSLLISQGKKITDKELREWVKKKAVNN